MPNSRPPEFLARIREHVEQYRRTDGAEGGQRGTLKILLLTTTNRKTGTPFTVPLSYYEDNEGLVVIASNGGLDEHPNWYLNIQQNPKVQVKVFADEYPTTARTATNREHAKLWPKITAIAPGYATYQEGTMREIPLVILRKKAEG